MSEAIEQIDDKPGQHGMFLVGTDRLFACHMPMFTKEEHMYQVILEVSLEREAMRLYQEQRKRNPANACNLTNIEDCVFALPSIATGTVAEYPADIYESYSNDGGGTPGKKILSAVKVSVERVVVFRHLDIDFDYPEHLTYFLFGSSTEAHLSHYISRDPDFQHILTLSDPPGWISNSLLEAGVTINFKDLRSTPIPCSDPLSHSEYEVFYCGKTHVGYPLTLDKSSTIWFSTGNMLNSKDPCASDG